MSKDRLIAAVAALAGWAGLAIQLVLLTRNLGFGLGLWRFVGFFTILTNVGAAAVATAIAFGQTHGLAGRRARLMAATSIVMVGLVYSLALRSLWNPTGAQKAADVLLHDATPLLWLILWLVGRNGGLRRSDIGWALAPPVLYVAYALARGAADGWYAYWFLDPRQQNLGELLTSMGILLCAFAAVAATLAGIERLFARGHRDAFDKVEEAGEGSFPASDPPSWTLGEDRRQ